MAKRGQEGQATTEDERAHGHNVDMARLAMRKKVKSMHESALPSLPSLRKTLERATSAMYAQSGQTHLRMSFE